MRHGGGLPSFQNLPPRAALCLDVRTVARFMGVRTEPGVGGAGVGTCCAPLVTSELKLKKASPYLSGQDTTGLSMAKPLNYSRETQAERERFDSDRSGCEIPCAFAFRPAGLKTRVHPVRYSASPTTYAERTRQR
jgi:hypothetical protein